ncbi:MAG: M50 family peptidase [Deltaproteobacteria bacterium]|nr:MAG: M50 family peptidase [Deltaproteobacteria bacterium]
MSEHRTPWLRLIILLAIAVGFGWAWHHWALWPLKIIVVLFHELGHATAAWLTGGEVLEIGLSPQEGGYTVTRGGNPLVILNAGYLGSMLTGMAFLLFSRDTMTSRGVALFLAGLLIALPFPLMAWLSFGQIFTLISGLVLLPLALFLPSIALRWGLRALGVFSVVYGIYDVWSDVLVMASEQELLSDAAKLEQLTGVPSLVWGMGWVVLGIGILIVGRKLLV